MAIVNNYNVGGGTNKASNIVSNIGNSVAGANLGNSILNAVLTTAQKNKTAAKRANDISFEAQNNAMRFNSGMASAANALNTEYLMAQMNYNEQAAQQANALNQAMWEQSAKYNSEEAQKQRDWQERMSGTAYQRAVADLRAAGLNPILAAMNGGATVGAGATGSMGTISAATANAGLQGAQSASVGGFTGILENTSNMLALAGAIADGFSGIASAIDASKALGNDKDLESLLGTLINMGDKPSTDPKTSTGDDRLKMGTYEGKDYYIDKPNFESPLYKVHKSMFNEILNKLFK